MEQTISKNMIITALENPALVDLIRGEKTHQPTLDFIRPLLPYNNNHEYYEGLVKAILPKDYSGNTPEEIKAIVENAIQKGMDKESKKKKQTSGVAGELIEMILERDIKICHDSSSRALIEIESNGKSMVFLLNSGKAKNWLKHQYYLENGKPISQQAFQQALDILEAIALYESPEIEVFSRVGKFDEKLIINLANEKGQVVIIDSEGYKITTESPVKFYTSSTMNPQSAPIKGGGEPLKELQKILNIEDAYFYRIVAFILNAYKPDGPYFCMIAEGEQGSGKSLLTLLIKLLVDPSSVDKLRLPKSEVDLMIAAKDTHLLLFDNMSGINNDLSDALCVLSTGGGYSTRKYYTNDEQHVFNQCRPFMCNGINNIVHRPDLIDRAISFKLPPMPIEKRRTEKEILRDFNHLRPYILDSIFMALSYAIRNFDAAIPPKNIRMADAAQWLVAAQEGLPFEDGKLIEAIQDSQKEIYEEAMSNNSLAVAISDYLYSEGDFSGHVGDIFNILHQNEYQRDKYFPKSSAAFSSALERLKPALEKIGIGVEKGPKDRKGRYIKIFIIDKP